MKILSRPKTPVGFIVIISVVLAALFALFYISRAGAADETATRDGRLVTFHDRGAQRVIVTKSDTVQAAAREAGISFDKNDIVEPGLDEKLVATDYTVNIYRARPVIVTDGMVRQKIMTAGQTPEKIASDAGITLHDEDKTSVQPVRDVVEEGAGVELLIARATSFTLVLYGEKTTVYTQKKTVGEMLSEKKITIAEDDTVSVKKSDPLTEGMIVEIWRNGKQTITEEQDIAFETEKIQDADREIGFKEVKTPGVKGKKSVSYEVEMKNGKEVARKEIQSVVTTQPKKQVEIVGVKMKSFGGSCNDWMTAAGITDLANASYLIGKESGCNPYSVNKSSGACGVGQALPCSKTGCEMGDGACQTAWMNSYVLGRYGSWASAANHHRQKGWY
ncbi:DUF348 domain-containing protein [Candidatus Saccharibacteria bacterium]|nr:DUF348 domain-containing protein [Candidatus Saccharibacteria bacterium]MBH1972396.1 DUF348 domain-containing protein [Candidatus Saccharibacteria bacterium]MBH1990262.1 DUF348 domain-containing protein [Candidatus Saccharibacteria bacterium]